MPDNRTAMVTSSWVKCKTHTPMTKNWNLENLVPKARPELHGFDGGFSVPRCSFASDGIAASLQHVSAFLFFS